jgi:hypothetical protein
MKKITVLVLMAVLFLSSCEAISKEDARLKEALTQEINEQISSCEMGIKTAKERIEGNKKLIAQSKSDRMKESAQNRIKGAQESIQIAEECIVREQNNLKELEVCFQKSKKERDICLKEKIK